MLIRRFRNTLPSRGDLEGYSTLSEVKSEEISLKKRFQCEHCGKSYKQKSSLNTHRRIHTGEMPFKCEDCGKRFKQQVNLTYHKRIHSNEQPFECEDCGKRFRFAKYLSNHKKHRKSCSRTAPDCDSIVETPIEDTTEVKIEHEDEIYHVGVAAELEKDTKLGISRTEDVNDWSKSAEIEDFPLVSLLEDDSVKTQPLDEEMNDEKEIMPI